MTRGSLTLVHRIAADSDQYKIRHHRKEPTWGNGLLVYSAGIIVILLRRHRLPWTLSWRSVWTITLNDLSWFFITPLGDPTHNPMALADLTSLPISLTKNDEGFSASISCTFRPEPQSTLNSHVLHLNRAQPRDSIWQCGQSLIINH